MTLPRVTIAAPAVKRVRNDDCWVFQDEVARTDRSPGAGEIVEVVDRQGTFLAYAFYHARSHIALRVVSTSQARPIDGTLVGERLSQAIAKRRHLAHTNAKRLVFSEADGLPGLIVDQYAQYLVVQIRTAGMERLRSVVIDLLRDLVQPAGILERSDREFRDEEGLPPVTQVVAGTVPERILIEEHGLQFWVDPHHGQKTGFYLDQRRTRQRLRELIQPGQRVLDTFSYTGSLAITAAVCGARVVGVEQQESVLALAKENATLNHVEDRVEWIAGNAFYWLEAQAKVGARYDWVLLDPPSLAKTKSEVTKGRQALHHLLVQALALLGPGGSIGVSVCTYHLLGLVEEIVRIAAAQQSARLCVRDQWLQASDHPWILQIPPTRYLTSWIVERDARSGDSPTSTAR
ncbi:MAG: class I SAM-dependent rRNA methyltransferase [Candidatus Omnitrophica bacterium]|nr:class I SAM-dependent rRNA methyltransferase [Candidatus Omnitrophota bacterium]